MVDDDVCIAAALLHASSGARRPATGRRADGLVRTAPGRRVCASRQCAAASLPCRRPQAPASGASASPRCAWPAGRRPGAAAAGPVLTLL